MDYMKMLRTIYHELVSSNARGRTNSQRCLACDMDDDGRRIFIAVLIDGLGKDLYEAFRRYIYTDASGEKHLLEVLPTYEYAKQRKNWIDHGVVERGYFFPCINAEIFFSSLSEFLLRPSSTMSSQIRIRKLIEETGSFTKSNDLVNKFLEEKLIVKEDRVLHVSLCIGDETCICGIAEKVEHLESLVKDLKRFFDVDKVTFYHPKRKPGDDLSTAVVEIEPGTKSTIKMLRPKHDWCSTYPLIKDIGMAWKFANEESFPGLKMDE